MYKCHRPTTKKAYWLYRDKNMSFEKAVYSLYCDWLAMSSKKSDRKCILEAWFKKGDKNTEYEFAIQAKIGTTEFLVYNIYEPLHSSFVWEGKIFKQMIKEMIKFHVKKGLGKMYCINLNTHCKKEMEEPTIGK